ncbi:hypothetical protein EZS27_001230 [termite gut metagenome]|uniref:DUF4292 domain-containing protein n=1 Tax=termite gut metagenome TaxID=433724 RepID=A0A5J4T1A6_9ZZZZ
MIKPIKNLFLSLLCVLLLGACGGSRSVLSGEKTPRFLSSKLQLTIPYQSDLVTLSGTMKMISGEYIQLSLLMPMFHSEIVRIDITPNEILFVDRMNKRYVRAAESDINALLTRRVNFGKIEKLLHNAALSGEKAIITTKDLNLKSPYEAKLYLYDFSTASLTIVPTKVSERYKPVALDELLKFLLNL